MAWATPVDLALRNGGLLSSTARTLSPIGLATGSSLVPERSLIVSTRAPIGYVAETTIPLAFNQGCRGLVSTTDSESRYFRYQLLSMVDRLNAVGQGSTFVELSGEALASMEVVVPPVRAQRAIADFLDAETARIDGLIAKKRRLIELLDGRWQAVVSAILWPAGATTIRLKYLTGSATSGNRDHASFTPTDEGIPCLRGLNIRPGRIDSQNLFFISEADHHRHAMTALQPGDVVVVRSGLAGSAVAIPEGLGECNCVDLVIVRRSPAIMPRFLELVINSREAQDQVARRTAGALLTHFNAVEASELLIPHLSLEAQADAVAALDDAEVGHQGLRRRLVRQIDLLVEHRQALITAAVTGELAVPGVAA